MLLRVSSPVAAIPNRCCSPEVTVLLRVSSPVAAIPRRSCSPLVRVNAVSPAKRAAIDFRSSSPCEDKVKRCSAPEACVRLMS